MSTQNPFQLETLAEGALILGPGGYLKTQLIKRLTTHNLTIFQDLSTLPPDLELDYLLIFDSLDFTPNSELTALLVAHHPRALYLAHVSRAGQLDSSLPRITKLFYADCFGPNYLHAPFLTQFLDQALGEGSIILPGDGLTPYRLLTETDLVEGIFLALTSSKLNNPLYLAGEESISLLSLAYLTRSALAKDLAISFNESENWSDYSYSLSKLRASKEILSWQPRPDLQAALSAFIKQYQPQITPSPAPSPQPSRPHLSKLVDLVTPTPALSSAPSYPDLEFIPLPRPSRRFSLPSFRRPSFKRPRALSIVVGGIIFATALYLALLIAGVTLTALTLRSYRQTIENNSLPSRSSLASARIPAIFIEANLVALHSLPGVKNSTSLSSLVKLASSYREGLDALLLANNLGDTSAALLSYVLGGGSGDITNLINQARLESDELYESLSLLDGSLPLDPPTVIPSRYRSAYPSLKSSLMTLRKHTLTAKALFAVSPDLLGVGDRRKYLVLFQNNMELRPTGGFIGSFAILSFENGVLYDMPIYDVYAADGQLKGHVEPPPEIKTYLGEANWYLRDSNWDPDFPTSARRAEWFLTKTLNQEVQGTIALNIYSLASILEAVGPITLPDYAEEITGNNIFERAEYHSEVNFFPGSTQKKEFLSSVADSLFSRLRTLDRSQALPVARALAQSIDEKNTLLAIESDITNHAFSALGWNGELHTPTCASLGNDCYSDYAMLVDSNFGVNKANYFLRRSLELKITIDKDLGLSHRLTTIYQNTSASSSWPAGPYKSYTRLYVPSGAILDSVSIDGQVLAENKVTLSVEHDRTVYGFLLEVPINSTVPVEIAYRLSSSLDKTTPTYSFYWQKQSGTAPDPLNIYLNYPLFLEPVLISPKATLNPQQLEFNLSNITDRRVTVKFK